MVSSALPFTDHLVAAQLKRQHPTLRWVADTGDPFSFASGALPNNELLYRRLNRRAEEHVIARCDRCTVTAQQVLVEYQRQFPDHVDRFVLVPPVVNPSSIPQGSTTSSARNDGKIVLVYAGEFYEEIRPPGPMVGIFLQLLRERPDLADRLEFHIMGNATEFVRREFRPLEAFPGLVTLHGLQDRSVVLRWLAQADVLINVGNTTAFQLPSKVVEYAATGKAVLNFYQQPGDSSREYFREYPLALSVFVELGREAQMDLVEQLGRFVETAPGSLVPQDQVHRFIGPSLVSTVATQVAGLLAGT